MARYEHLPIFRAAFDLAVHVEKIVRGFSRYHKYTLGTELRDGSRRILQRIIEANESRGMARTGRADRPLGCARFTIVRPPRPSRLVGRGGHVGAGARTPARGSAAGAPGLLVRSGEVGGFYARSSGCSATSIGRLPRTLPTTLGT